MKPILELQNLNIFVGERQLVTEMSLVVYPGECVALVGESGSGKSLTAKSLVGLLPKNLVHEVESFQINGQEVAEYTDKQWQKIRGAEIGFIVQDALSALDPLRKLKYEVTEALTIHENLSSRDRDKRATLLLEEQEIPEATVKINHYPGQLSGGQRQRALISSVLAVQPKIIIADEPTSSLDPGLAAQQLTILRQLKNEGYSIILISHDFGMVKSIADRVLVLRQGITVEQGDSSQILDAPETPYAQTLLHASNRLSLKAEQQNRASASKDSGHSHSSSPLISVKSVTKRYQQQNIPALDHISFDIVPGVNVGIAGASGSGKTTLIKTMLGLEEPNSGTIQFLGEPWSNVSERQRRSLRHHMQWVPQDPYNSMNPRWTAEKVLREAIKNSARFRQHDREPQKRKEEVVKLAETVGLNRHTLSLNTARLSGGQRQRLALARSLAMKPQLLILDEALNALDVSIQVQMIDLIREVQEKYRMTIVTISHDLPTLKELSEELIVLDHGRIVERGPTGELLSNPQHPATQLLVHNSQQIR